MAAVQIKSARFHHDRIIDFILEAPTPPSQNEIAKIFGFSATWVSIIINSDAFKHRLEERKAELIDPKIRASIVERLDGLAKSALDKLIERIDSPIPIKTSDLVAIAKLGVGDKNTRPAAPVNQNNLYVVALPPTAESSDKWLENAQRRPQGVPSKQEKDEGGFTPFVEIVQKQEEPPKPSLPRPARPQKAKPPSIYEVF